MGKKKLYKEDGITEDFDAESKEVDEAEAAPGLLDELAPHEDSSKPVAQTEEATTTAHTADEATVPAGEASAEAPKSEMPEPVESEAEGTDIPELNQEPAVAPATNAFEDEGLAPKTTDEKAELAATDHTPAELEPSQASTPNVEPGIDAKDEDVIKASGELDAAPKADAPAEPSKPSEESAAPAAEEPAAFGDLQSDVSDLVDHVGSEALDEMKKAGDALTPAVSKLHGIEEKLEHLGDEAKARFVHAKTMLVNAMGALERLFHRG